MSMVRNAIACWLLFLAGPVDGAESETRIWTNLKRQSFEGKLVETAGEKVVIERKDGKRFVIAVATLSEDDQKYVGEHATSTQPVPQPKPDGRTSGGKPRGGMLAGYDASKSNFGDPWPTTVKCEDKVEITTIKEDLSDKCFIYESPHFRFESNAVMRKSLISKIALLFESAYEWHSQVPLNNRRTRAKDAAKLQARLFETKEQYHDAGGPSTSIGVYMGANDTFMVPFSEVGCKKVGSGYMFDFSGDVHTILHELTHQLWADVHGSMPVWMSEGLAEYMGCVSYRTGTFSYSGHERAVREYALGYGKKGNGGRALGDQFTMPHLEILMGMDQPTFYTEMNAHYAFGLMLTTFFIDMDGKKDGAVFKKAVEAMQGGKSAQETNQVLLDGRSYEELERDFAKAWRGNGAKIEFK